MFPKDFQNSPGGGGLSRDVHLDAELTFTTAVIMDLTSNRFVENIILPFLDITCNRNVGFDLFLNFVLKKCKSRCGGSAPLAAGRKTEGTGPPHLSENSNSLKIHRNYIEIEICATNLAEILIKILNLKIIPEFEM